MIGLMKVAPGNATLELREIALREPTAGEAVIRVRYAGICGTDLHIVADHFPSYPPVILGHEFTGTVERVGEGVDPAWVDARVVCEPHASACLTCFLCRGGNPEICASKRSPGWGVNGAFASHVIVPAWLLHRVPDALPDEVAVLAEPMAVTMTALRRGHLAAGDVVLVVGPGPVGLLAALAARASGAADVVVAGRSEGSAPRDRAPAGIRHHRRGTCRRRPARAHRRSRRGPCAGGDRHGGWCGGCLRGGAPAGPYRGAGHLRRSLPSAWPGTSRPPATPIWPSP